MDRSKSQQSYDQHVATQTPTRGNVPSPTRMGHTYKSRAKYKKLRHEMLRMGCISFALPHPNQKKRISSRFIQTFIERSGSGENV